MITEIIFSIIILVLIGGFIAYVKETNKQIKGLTDAVAKASLAKTVHEYESKPIEHEETEEILPDSMLVETLSDDEFSTMIKKQLEKENINAE